ncbi:MAG: MFS transporter [Deltaproteobacteria bacterium]|nr:MFS transporter [Deltaproteobacteria bacterium]
MIGAAAAAGVADLGVGVDWHAGVVGALLIVAVLFVVRLLPRDEALPGLDDDGPGPQRTTWQERLSIWREPRILLIGLIVLGMAFAEGSANDWLALAVVDGRGVDEATGALAFGIFAVAMTTGRIAGVWVLDRFGRVPVLRGSAVLAAAGLAAAAGPYYRNLSLNVKMADVERPFKRRVAVLRDILEADVYISLAKMKTHGMTMLSGAVKNNYGLLAGAQKSWYHYYSERPELFAEILIEMYRLRLPDLVIMDGILAMEGYGPCSPEVHRVNRVLASTDAVALDAVMARMMGFGTDEVPYLRIARERGIGETDLGAIEIEGDCSPIPGFKRPVVVPESTYCYLSGVGGGKTSRAFFADRVCYRPAFSGEKCPPGCAACVEACPVDALKPGIPPELLSEQCILCSACMEACPHGAVRLAPDETLLKRLREES